MMLNAERCSVLPSSTVIFIQYAKFYCFKMQIGTSYYFWALIYFQTAYIFSKALVYFQSACIFSKRLYYFPKRLYSKFLSVSQRLFIFLIVSQRYYHYFFQNIIQLLL
jgi:hypothetical protein